MAKTRSPRYPNVSLGEAISRAKMIYDREHMSPLSPAVAAEAMGYGGLNGTSLKVISSLRKYGLLEGRGEDVRISKDAQTLIIDDPSGPEYTEALQNCALNPELFSELRKQFPGGASERNIAVYLEKQGFKPDGAELAARNFRETMALVEGTAGPYSEPSKGERSLPMQTHHLTAQSLRVGGSTAPADAVPPLRVVMNGNRLDIQASVDLEGLKRLKEMLTKFESILQMMQDPPKGEAAN